MSSEEEVSPKGGCTVLYKQQMNVQKAKRHRKTSGMLYNADFKEYLKQEERVGPQGSVV